MRIIIKTYMNLKKYFFVFFFLLAGSLVAKKYLISAGEFTSTSATLNNARLSFRSGLQGTQVTGSSLVIIDTASYPSESVLQLQNRDTVLINDSVYTVATTIDDASDDTFNLTTGLDASDVTDDMGISASQSASLTVRLTTISALTAGSFRILVPAIGATAASHDGIPDSGGFEFGNTDGTPASIACPVTASYGTFTPTSTNAESASVTIDGVSYHSFVCAYSGAGAIGTPFDGSTEEAFIISNLINPSPKVGASNHTLGQADTYTVIIQQRDSSDAIIDQTVTKIGVVDAVKVSASIAPQLTFTIAGLAASSTACGVSTDVTTTALTVPFGALTIGSFVDAAQRLTVTTNAIGGYSVTAAENDQVGREANACATDGSASITCIIDNSMTGASHTTSADWVDGATYPGFGYSLDAVSGGPTVAFSFDESSRAFSAKQFADLAAAEAVQTIFTRATVTASDVVDVCYRIAPAATNTAGDYENYLVYTASATF